jgi:hypothetical protein
VVEFVGVCTRASRCWGTGAYVPRKILWHHVPHQHPRPTKTPSPNTYLCTGRSYAPGRFSLDARTITPVGRLSSPMDGNTLTGSSGGASVLLTSALDPTGGAAAQQQADSINLPRRRSYARHSGSSPPSTGNIHSRGCSPGRTVSHEDEAITNPTNVSCMPTFAFNVAGLANGTSGGGAPLSGEGHADAHLEPSPPHSQSELHLTLLSDRDQQHQHQHSERAAAPQPHQLRQKTSQRSLVQLRCAHGGPSVHQQQQQHLRALKKHVEEVEMQAGADLQAPLRNMPGEASALLYRGPSLATPWYCQAMQSRPWLTLARAPMTHHLHGITVHMPGTLGTLGTPSTYHNTHTHIHSHTHMYTHTHMDRRPTRSVGLCPNCNSPPPLHPH